MRARDLTNLVGPVAATCFALLLAAAPASAQETLPPGEGEGEAPATTYAPAAEPSAVTPGAAQMSPTATGGPTDHQAVVGLWGVEARRIATVMRTAGQDPTCGANCPLDLNSLGFRRWASANYAYSFGLVFNLGGGSRRQADAAMTGNETATWDTYLGVGPTLGANFLLAQWRHVAVSFTPQLDAVFFMPGGSRSKALLLQARGLFEGEVHLGFWGLPQLSVALSSGLAAGFTWITAGEGVVAAPMRATEWSVGFAGPQSLWGLVTNASVRYYF